MELSKNYTPQETEEKWYQYWLKHELFASIPNEKPAYTIVIPPPNITGVLHMGHMLNNTIQDILIRKARMSGFNACWVPGTDHASIATEAKVWQYLQEQGINKSSITREDFLKYAMEWKEKYGGIILQQLQKLGASCDWSRTKFTMDESMTESVLRVFMDLYEKGHIYRGVRMINWDPAAKTALSDEEVIYKEVQSLIYTIQYRIEGETEQYITIATTRPETLLGDTAIAIHPHDNRYKHLHGKRAYIPLIDRIIPIITDEYVDMEFGTGALKVTPAHDMNDYQLGLKHNLPVIDILNDDGTMRKEALMYLGEDRFVVRKKIVKELDQKGFLVSSKEIQNKVGYSERTNAVVEPKLSMQWFCRMGDMAKPALDQVINNNIQFYPAKFKNTYQHWMENIKDWCISRQLWWGQRIPAWYYGTGVHDFVVALTPEDALNRAQEKTGKSLIISDLHQDEDVLDTWFSSWLWPISVFDGIRNPDSKELAYYYPTQDLVTGPDIIFFWVARMIMAGYEFTDQKPFKNVYFTGIIRDKLGRKMSKSLGNSPDTLALIDQYGADGVRAGMLFSSPAGNDLLFDESLCQQGRNFCNKLWNSYRLIHSMERRDIPSPELNQIAADWIEERIHLALEEINDHFIKYRLSDALMTIYKLIWDDYCSWYLEMIKPAYGEPLDQKTYDNTIIIFEKLLQILHPFMPFITEELWQSISPRKSGESISISKWPESTHQKPELIQPLNLTHRLITEIRNFKNAKGLSPKEPIQLIYKKDSLNSWMSSLLQKMVYVNEFLIYDQDVPNTHHILIDQQEFYIPLSGDLIDPKEELMKINQELDYTKGFLQSVLKKLENERFVQNAPKQVLDVEYKKKTDAEDKIKVLENKISQLMS